MKDPNHGALNRSAGKEGLPPLRRALKFTSIERWLPLDPGIHGRAGASPLPNSNVFGLLEILRMATRENIALRLAGERGDGYRKRPKMSTRHVR